MAVLAAAVAVVVVVVFVFDVVVVAVVEVEVGEVSMGEDKQIAASPTLILLCSSRWRWFP